ncbi:MAG: hypothetical protein ACI8SI_002728 [Congregibacter sp.]
MSNRSSISNGFFKKEYAAISTPFPSTLGLACPDITINFICCPHLASTVLIKSAPVFLGIFKSVTISTMPAVVLTISTAASTSLAPKHS